MSRDLTILEAMDDERLFGGLFTAPSWTPWRAVLAAIFGLSMDDEALALYRRHTGRQAPPTGLQRYVELVIGRRGGKSRMLALVACYLAAVKDHSKHLVPGETPVIAIIAQDRKSGQVILNYIKGLLRVIPLLSDIVEDQTIETIKLSNGVVIEIHTASISAPRGRTFLAVLCDETAFWAMGDSSNPDVEVINAVRPGLSTIPYSLLIIVSSPYARQGVLYSNYAKYYGREDAPVLVWQATSFDMNSNLVGDPVAADMEATDPERFSAEYMAQFRLDIAEFITREAVEACVARGAIELPHGASISYVAFVDPSGGSADSFALAIGHLEGEIAVLDCVREVKPPFSPDSVCEEFATLLKSYGVTRVVGDRYAGEWPRERFRAHGVEYDLSERVKSTIYLDVLPLINSRRVRLLDNKRLANQLVTLERRTHRGGKDSIDKASGTHDDIANVVAGVATLLIADRRPPLVDKSALLGPDNKAVAMPKYCGHLYAVLWFDVKSGQTAVVYAATTYAPPIGVLILDFDCGPVRADFFAAIDAKIRELWKSCGALRGAHAYTPEALVKQANAAGLWAEKIPKEFLYPEALLGAAAHMGNGRVKICSAAQQRAANTPFAASLDFRAAEGDGDVLRQASILAITMALDGAG